MEKGRLGPDPHMVHVWALTALVLQAAIWVVLASVVAVFVTWGNPAQAILLILLFVAFASGTSYAWASLFAQFYRWEFGPEQMHMWRGILYRRRVTIPYMRIQNVNVLRTPLLLLFGLSNIEVETAGGRGIPYASFRSEGFLPGVRDGERIADELVERAKRAKVREGL